MRFIRLFFVLFSLMAFRAGAAPDTLRVLFVGNSYVQVNNLPDIIAQMATNRGDVLLRTDASVGGYTLQNHYTNANTRNQISKKGWDFVVLQEQSQLPSFPDAQVASDCYPYARALDSLAHLANPCAKTLFYMTWGRKIGDASNCPFFPLVCTYDGMDSLLRSRYSILAKNNKAVLSPVGVAWHRMRDLFPMTELYQTDESHPSEAGSYLAAATFYTLLFRKNPSNVTYDFTLSPADAANIRQVVKEQVWDSISRWYQYRTAPPKPVSAFIQNVNGRIVQFSNSSQNAISYQWLFGDGQTDTAASPKHTYAANGIYTVRLIAINCDAVRDTLTRQLVIGTTGIGQQVNAHSLSIYPNPARDNLHIECAEVPEHVTLYDAAGRVFREMTRVQNKRVSLELNGLPAGVYLLRVVFKGGGAVVKVVGVAE